MTEPAPRIRAALVGSAPSGPYVIAVFCDGSARRYDLGPLLDFGPFAPLRDGAQLRDFTVLPYGHGIEWACGGDISARHIHASGEPVDLTFAEPEAVAA